jgi:hypothetical protein
MVAINQKKNPEIARTSIGCSRDQRLRNAQLYFVCWGVAAGGVNLLQFEQNPLALNEVPHMLQ